MENAFFLTNWILLGMRWLYENITNGSIILTILISTVVIRLVTVYGDIKSRRSNMKMQAIQPEIQKLQKKYKDNPQKLQQAQQKLMRESGTSMLGGCLPMLITMPLFFCFIAAFRYWGYEMQIRALLELNETGASQLFESFKVLWVTNIWQPDVGHKTVMMAAEEFLAIPDLGNLIFFKENPAALETFKNLGFLIEDVKNIPQASIDTYNQIVAPITARYAGYANGWYAFPLIAGGTMFLSTWLMQRKQPQPAPAENGEAAPGAGMTKIMMYMFPVMSIFFCLSANTAFAIYWTISSVVTMITNMLINKLLEKEKLALETKGEVK